MPRMLRRAHDSQIHVVRPESLLDEPPDQPSGGGSDGDTVPQTWQVTAELGTRGD